MTKQQLTNQNIILGVDVDKKHYVFTARDQGVNVMHKTLVAKPEVLHNFITKSFPNKRPIFVYESGPTGFGLYDYLIARNVPCNIISTLSMPFAKNETVKNNHIDSQKLAEYLEAGKLKPIRVPEGEYRELRHLVKTRELYVSHRVKAKQRIKGLLLFTSLHESLPDTIRHWSNNYIKSLKDLKTSPAVRYRLDGLLRDLEYARNCTLLIHKEIKSFCKAHTNIEKNVEYLRSIPGIGFIVSISILGNIGDPSLLKNPRELACFLGLTPWESSTGDKVNRGSITHFGNKVLRKLLVEAAWATIRKDGQLYRFFCRIKSRNNPKTANRIAIVAVARKMTHIIYRVLKDQRVYVKY